MDEHYSMDERDSMGQHYNPTKSGGRCSEAAGKPKSEPPDQDTEPPAALQQEELKEPKELKELKEQKELKELKELLKEEPRCQKYAVEWVEKNGVGPAQLLEFVRGLRGDNKPSWWPRIPSWPQRPSIPPPVRFSVCVTGQTFGAHDTILGQLKDKRLKATNLQCIVVFCPVTTRAGSDAEAAMMTPEVAACHAPVILALMHHTRDKDYPTDVVTHSKFPKVKCEVHFLFHESQPGLLNCAHNTAAVQELTRAICSCGSG